MCSIEIDIEDPRVPVEVEYRPGPARISYPGPYHRKRPRVDDPIFSSRRTYQVHHPPYSPSSPPQASYKALKRRRILRQIESLTPVFYKKKFFVGREYMPQAAVGYVELANRRTMYEEEVVYSTYV